MSGARREEPNTTRISTAESAGPVYFPSTFPVNVVGWVRPLDLATSYRGRGGNLPWLAGVIYSSPARPNARNAWGCPFDVTAVNHIPPMEVELPFGSPISSCLEYQRCVARAELLASAASKSLPALNHIQALRTRGGLLDHDKALAIR